MKKTACVALMLAVFISAVLGLTACMHSAPDIPDGYQLYDDGTITFAYPADWGKTDGSIVVLTGDGVKGNNITVGYEQETDLYATMTAESFEETLRPVYEAMGLTVSDVTVEQVKNGSGTPLTVISHTTVMNGGSMFQTMFIHTVDGKTYIVTVTETTDAPELVETVFDTLFDASAQ